MERRLRHQRGRGRGWGRGRAWEGVLVFLILVALLGWCQRKPDLSRTARSPATRDRLAPPVAPTNGRLSGGPFTQEPARPLPVLAEIEPSAAALSAPARKGGEAAVGGLRPEFPTPAAVEIAGRITADPRPGNLPVPSHPGVPGAETPGSVPERREVIGALLPEGPPVTEMRGRITQTLDSSRGVFSDRSFTTMETAVRLDGVRGADSFALSGRWRQVLAGDDLSGDLPPYFLTEAWYRYGFGGGSGLSVGRQYLTDVGSELVDGVTADVRLAQGLSVGAFAGFRPDPFYFGFRGDAATAGLSSRWAGEDYGDFTSRQAVVFNWFEKQLDRAYLFWEADKRFGADLWLRQYLVADFAPGARPGLTTYSLGADWQATEEWRLGWQADMYRSAPYRASLADVPTDTSYTYSTSLSLRRWFTRQYLGDLSASYAYREFDQERVLSFSGGLAAMDWLRSGVDADLRYSSTRYESVFYENYAVDLRRPFGPRLSLGAGAQYSRNLAEDSPGDASEARFATLYGTAHYILSDCLDLSVYYEYQRAELRNGDTVGLGFDRDPELLGTPDSADGYNLTVALNWRF